MFFTESAARGLIDVIDHAWRPSRGGRGHTQLASPCTTHGAAAARQERKPGALLRSSVVRAYIHILQRASSRANPATQPHGPQRGDASSLTCAAMCGTCEGYVTGQAYDGNDFLPSGGPCPKWWGGLPGAGSCQVATDQPALIFESKESCCTFCIEHNRRGMQPPCTHASFGPTSRGLTNVCYAKTGPPPPLVPHHDRDSFLAGESCAVYVPPAASRAGLSWGMEFVAVVLLVAAVYLLGGIALRSKIGGHVGGEGALSLRRHPHYRRWRAVAGLVVDGVEFLRNRGHGRHLLQGSGGGGSDSGGTTPPGCTGHAIRQAKRGQAGPLHHAASAGNATKLQALLAEKGKAEAAQMDTINAGDHRRYTPFILAAAGGCHLPLDRVHNTGALSVRSV
jgi:hypothetical protein